MMINSVKTLLATTLLGLLMASSAQAGGDNVIKLVFHNCMHTPFTVYWDAYHYNINTPWKPELERPKGTFVVADSTSVDLHATDEALGFWEDGYMNMHLETPRGHIWIKMLNYPKFYLAVIRGSAVATPLASSESGFQIDIACPWNKR